MTQENVGEKDVFDLSKGESIQISYQGKPITIEMARGSKRLEIAKPTDLDPPLYWEKEVDMMVIVDRSLLDISKHQRGYKGLRPGEVVILGRLNPSRFLFDEEVDFIEATVIRVGNWITIESLSPSGTRVIIDN